MSKLAGFSFDGYTVRQAGERDREYLTRLIAEDDCHRDRMTPDFFLKTMPGVDSWALEDEQGKAIFYFRTSTAVRIAIQFCDSATLDDRRRNQGALIKGLRWIEGMFRANRFTEILFDTEGAELEVFAKRHLGFQGASVLTKTIIPLQDAPSSQPEDLGTVPTGRLEGRG